MKINHSAVILAVLLGFVALMFWSVLTRSVDAPGKRALETGLVD